MKRSSKLLYVAALAAVIGLLAAGCKNDLTKTANKNPKADDYDISGFEQTFDGSPKSVTIEPRKGKSPGTVTVLYNKSRTVPSDVGNYAVTFNVAAARGWNAASGLRAGTLVISADGNLTPTAEDYEISGQAHIYDGSPKSVIITPKDGKSTGDITISYDGLPTAPSDTGNYTVTFDVAAAAGWNAASDLFAGTMIIYDGTLSKQTPIAADYTISGLSQSYDGSSKSITITPKDGKSTGARTILYDGSAAAPSAAGTYTVTFDVMEAPGWNAASGLQAGTLTIADNVDSRVKYKIYSDGTLTEGFTITNWANANAFQLATTSGGGHSGTRAMQLPDNGEWNPPGRGLTIRAGSAANIDWSKVNALSFWIKAGSNLTVNSFGLLDDDGSGQDPLNVEYKGENKEGIALTTTWKNILIPLPASTAKGAAISKAEVFKLWLSGTDQNGKAVYIDDIELVSVTKTLTSITIPATANNIPTGTVSIASLLGNYKAQYTVDDKQLSLINKTAPNDDNGTVTFANWFNVAYNAGGGGATVSGDNLTVTGNFTLTVSFDGKTSNTLTGTVVQPSGGGGNQTPVKEDYTITGLTQAYNGSARTVTITPNSGKSSGARTILYNGSSTAPSAVGTYTVTFNVAAATGWNAVNGLSAGTLEITGQTPVVGDYTIGNLNQTLGSVTAVTITPNANKSTGARTILYNGSSTLPSAVGTYTVTFNVAAAAGWNSASGLSAGTLTITANTNSKVKYKIYADGTLTEGYTITNWANEGAFQLSTTAGGGHSPNTRAMRLPDTGNNNWGRGLSIRRTGTPAIDWSTVDALSFWVKGNNVRVNSFGLMDDAGSGGDPLNLEYKGESEQGITLTNTWQNILIPLPASTAKGAAISRAEVFKIYITNNAADQDNKAVYIDDIELITATKDHAITIPSSANVSAGTIAISSLVGNYKTAYTVDGKTVSLFNNTTKFTNWFNINYNVGGSGTLSGTNVNATGNFTLTLGFGGKTSNQLSATVTGTSGDNDPRFTGVRSYSTTNSNRFAQGTTYNFANGNGSNSIKINVSEGQNRGSIAGFGGSLTHGSAYIIYNSTNKSAAIDALFNPETGANFSVVRLAVGSSDFPTYVGSTYNSSGVQTSRGTLKYHSLCETEGPSNNRLQNFSIAVDKQELIPVIKLIQAKNPRVKFLGSPWSAPAWMKGSYSSGEGGMLGGQLRTDMEDTYAQYLVRFVQAYAAEGITIDYLTIQNEPAFGSSVTPTMWMSAAQEARMVAKLSAALSTAGLSTKIVVHDHNTDMWSSRVDGLLGDTNARNAYGVGMHGYSPNSPVSTFANNVKGKYPNIRLFFTEMTEGSSSNNFEGDLGWAVSNMIMPSAVAGSEAILYFNFALDQDGKPFIRPDWTNYHCKGLIELNTNNQMYYQSAFFALKHFAAFSRNINGTAANWIGCSSTNSNVTVAASKQANGKIAVTVFSSSSQNVAIQYNGKAFDVNVPGNRLTTFVWFAD